jgi:hypothetical protein
VLHLYIRLLARGNPVAVGLTLIVAVAVSVGPFYEGIKAGDPAAIGLAIGILVMIAILLLVIFIDRRNNPDRKSAKSANRAGRR